MFDSIIIYHFNKNSFHRFFNMRFGGFDLNLHFQRRKKSLFCIPPNIYSARVNNKYIFDTCKFYLKVDNEEENFETYIKHLKKYLLTYLRMEKAKCESILEYARYYCVIGDIHEFNITISKIAQTPEGRMLRFYCDNTNRNTEKDIYINYELLSSHYKTTSQQIKFNNRGGSYKAEDNRADSYNAEDNSGIKEDDLKIKEIEKWKKTTNEFMNDKLENKIKFSNKKYQTFTKIAENLDGYTRVLFLLEFLNKIDTNKFMELINKFKIENEEFFIYTLLKMSEYLIKTKKYKIAVLLIISCVVKINKGQDRLLKSELVRLALNLIETKEWNIKMIEIIEEIQESERSEYGKIFTIIKLDKNKIDSLGNQMENTNSGDQKDDAYKIYNKSDFKIVSANKIYELNILIKELKEYVNDSIIIVNKYRKFIDGVVINNIYVPVQSNEYKNKINIEFLAKNIRYFEKYNKTTKQTYETNKILIEQLIMGDGRNIKINKVFTRTKVYNQIQLTSVTNLYKNHKYTFLIQSGNSDTFRIDDKRIKININTNKIHLLVPKELKSFEINIRHTDNIYEVKNFQIFEK